MALGGWEIVLLGQGPKGEAIVNTFHYKSQTDEAANPDTATILCEGFKIAQADAIAASLTEDWQGFQVSARCISGPNLDQEFTLDATDLEGQLAGPSAPLQTCYILRRRTATTGKHGRGRLFFSPFPRTWVDVDGSIDDGGVVTPPLITALLAPLVTVEGTYDPCLWNKNAGGIVGLQKITHMAVSSVAGVMRSRRVRFPN